MNVDSVVGPAVIAAFVSGVITIIGFAINRATTRELHTQRLDADFKLLERKAGADIELARLKLKLDRDMEQWRLRTAFAEEILADFYKARDVFASARRPFAFGGEGSSRPGAEKAHDSPSLVARKNAAYAPVERLNKELEFFTALAAKRYRFAVVFGKSADDAFSAFVGAYQSVVNASWELIRSYDFNETAGEDSYLDITSLEHFRMLVGWGRSDKDEISSTLATAVKRVEEIVLPVLRGNMPE